MNVDNQELDNNEVETINDINSEHVSIPKDNKNDKKLAKLMMIGAGLLLIYFLANFFTSSNKKNQDSERTTETANVNVDTGRSFKFDLPLETSNADTNDKIFDEPIDSPPEILLGDPVIVNDAQKITKSSSGFMIKSGDNLNASPNSSSSPIYASDSVVDKEEISNNIDSDIFRAPAFNAANAKKSKYNPHLLLSQGTLIQCVLRGRLVSNVSGQISCIVTDNVLSQSGNVVLIEKGSRVNGYYQGATARHGSNEIFAVWQEIRTPNNLVIPLYSGSTDELGANGLSGWADNHFWARFKNAILLSIVKDVSGALASRAGRDGQYDYSQNTREGSEDVAKTVLDQMGDIRPTIYKNQGDKVGIFVARDVDFSSVYKLKRVSYEY